MKTTVVLQILQKYSHKNRALSESSVEKYAKENYEIELSENDIKQAIKELQKLGYNIQEEKNRYAITERPFSQTEVDTAINAIATSNLTDSEKELLLRAVESKYTRFEKKAMTENYKQIEAMHNSEIEGEELEVHLTPSDRIVYEYLLKNGTIDYDQIIAITRASSRGGASAIVKRMRDNNIITVINQNGSNVCKLKNRVKIPDTAVSLEQINDIEKINAEKLKLAETRANMRQINAITDRIDEIIELIEERVKWHVEREKPWSEFNNPDKQFFRSKLRELFEKEK